MEKSKYLIHVHTHTPHKSVLSITILRVYRNKYLQRILLRSFYFVGYTKRKIKWRTVGVRAALEIVRRFVFGFT